MSKIKLIITVILSIFSTKLFCQNINKGELYVSNQTNFISLDEFVNDTLSILENNGFFYALQSITNNGSFYFNQDEDGTFVFSGSSEQVLAGDSIFRFNNLRLENEENYSLSNSASVHGNAEFSDGVLKLEDSSARLTFKENSGHSESSEYSYINGEVIKIGSSSFVFPCGDENYYRPAFISAPNENEDVFTCDYIHENSDLLYSHENISGTIRQINEEEYWVINQVNGNSEVVIGLSYKLGSTPNFITENLSLVRILRWDLEAELWIDEGGINSASESMIYTTTSLDKYGIFTLGVVDRESAEEDIIVYNLLTPNGDGMNDFLVLEGIEKYDINQVSIFNRWGQTVFEIEGYDNSEKVFDGFANVGLYNSNSPLPDGTYFYVVKYASNTSEARKKVGFLELSIN